MKIRTPIGVRHPVKVTCVGVWVCGCVGVVYAHDVGFLLGEFFVLVCFNFLVIFWRVCPFLW